MVFTEASDHLDTDETPASCPLVPKKSDEGPRVRRAPQTIQISVCLVPFTYLLTLGLLSWKKTISHPPLQVQHHQSGNIDSFLQKTLSPTLPQTKLKIKGICFSPIDCNLYYIFRNTNEKTQPRRTIQRELFPKN